MLLFNLGGPDDLASVEPFLVNLFTDREIIQLPGGAALQPWIARLIAKVRGPSVRDNYRRIGGGSPQLRITREQARTLEQRLNFGNADGSPDQVFIADAVLATVIRRCARGDRGGGNSTDCDADAVSPLVEGDDRFVAQRIRPRAAKRRSGATTSLKSRTSSTTRRIRCTWMR